MLATEAAALFRRKGLSHFAFVGSPGAERWSEARRRFFRAALKDMGFNLNVFAPAPGIRSWRTRGNELAKWLVSLPKPCGVWAAFDQRAKHVLDACHLAGLNVPSQIQVLGVDNETYICEQTVPSLSSLMPDFENGGFLAEMTDEERESLHFVLMGGHKYYFVYLKNIEKGIEEEIPYRGNPPFTITDMPGVIGYDSKLETWFIAYVLNYTMVNYYYPDELSEEFQVKGGPNVIISGNVHEEFIDPRRGKWL